MKSFLAKKGFEQPIWPPSGSAPGDLIRYTRIYIDCSTGNRFVLLNFPYTLLKWTITSKHTVLLLKAVFRSTLPVDYEKIKICGLR